MLTLFYIFRIYFYTHFYKKNCVAKPFAKIVCLCALREITHVPLFCDLLKDKREMYGKFIFYGREFFIKLNISNSVSLHFYQ